jgi:hypothetical protein
MRGEGLVEAPHSLLVVIDAAAVASFERPSSC